MQILIIEDEFSLADIIATRLQHENYKVDISLTGDDGYSKAETGVYDLIILDVMLPKKDGFSILTDLRKEQITSKIIMLTAKSELEDKLTCFNSGADDYVTKPFHIDELVARVNVQLQKQYPIKANKTICFNDLELNISTSKLTCTVTNETVELICKEYQLLEYFLTNPEQVLSKEQIYDKVWGIESEIESNNLEVYLTFIRRKLKAINSKTTIKSVRGLGYRLEVKHEKVKG